MFAGVTFAPDVKICFHSQPTEGRQPQEILSDFFSKPYCPIDLIGDDVSSRFSFDVIKPGQSDSFKAGEVTVESVAVKHPGGSLSFRLTYKGRSFCYLSDYEYGGTLDPALRDCLYKSDLTVFDAYFSNDNFIPGWGHSTWEEGVEIWQEAKIKKMAMYHHHIARTDDELDALDATIRAISPSLFVAKDGMEVI